VKSEALEKSVARITRPVLLRVFQSACENGEAIRIMPAVLPVVALPDATSR
jgi:hypothetical protein